MLQGVEHIALCAENVPDLVAWFQRVLPVELVSEGQAGPAFLKFPDGFLLEVIESAGDRPEIPRYRDKGFRHIALSVSSLETMAMELKEQGVEVVEDVKTVPDGPKLFCFRDIEGNIIQLVER